MSQHSNVCRDTLWEEGRKILSRHFAMRQRTKQMVEKHCRNNKNMSRQKVSKNHEETLDLCHDIQIPYRDTTMGELNKFCHDIAKIVVTRVKIVSGRRLYDNIPYGLHY